MTRITTLRTVTLSTLTLLALAACGTDDDGGGASTPAAPQPPPGTTPAPSSQATFSSLYANIFAPRCLSCHNPGNMNGNVDLTSHQSIMNSQHQNLVVPGDPLRSDLNNAVATNRMPKNGPPLSAAEKLAIFTWIQQGAQNN